MYWPFQSVKEFLDILIARSQARAEGDRSNHEAFLLHRLSRGGEAKPQKVVDGALEGRARAPGLVLDQAGDIVVEGECSAHIMMLGGEAS